MVPGRCSMRTTIFMEGTCNDTRHMSLTQNLTLICCFRLFPDITIPLSNGESGLVLNQAFEEHYKVTLTLTLIALQVSHGVFSHERHLYDMIAYD